MGPTTVQRGPVAVRAYARVMHPVGDSPCKSGKFHPVLKSLEGKICCTEFQYSNFL
jgi:hypothetical protein